MDFWESISDAIDEQQRNYPTMDLSTKTNEQIKFSYPENGRQSDVDHAAKYLKINAVYTVQKIFIGGGCSTVELKEIPSI